MQTTSDNLFNFSPYDLNFRNHPPPLPPKKISLNTTPMMSTPSHVFQPSLLARTPSNSSGINSSGTNRRNKQRCRVEAQRNSILSSEDEDETEHFRIHRHSLVSFFENHYKLQYMEPDHELRQEILPKSEKGKW